MLAFDVYLVLSLPDPSLLSAQGGRDTQVASNSLSLLGRCKTSLRQLCLDVNADSQHLKAFLPQRYHKSKRMVKKIGSELMIGKMRDVLHKAIMRFTIFQKNFGQG